MAELTGRKAELIAELDHARARLRGHSRGARAHLHPGEKLRASFQRQRIGWLGGATLAGLILAKLPPRTKKVPARQIKGVPNEFAAAGRAGFFLGTIKIVLDLLKPLLIAWATKRMGDIAQVAKRTERKVERVEQKTT